MPNFTGTLRANEVYGAIYNMIIAQRVDANNIAGTFSALVDAARVDGGMYGDTRLIYATDALKSQPWTGDGEASNLLQLHRPKSPSCQAISITKFRMIPCTIDNYLSKRAWSTEGAFASFNSILLGWITDTKRIYDSTNYNAWFGTHEGSATKANYEIDVTTAVGTATGEEAARLEGMTIARALADLMIELSDVSRDFNDYKYLRSYDVSAIKIVWNSKYVNKIRKVDLPTIFHKENLEIKMDEYVLPSRYFGVVIDASNIANFSDATPAAGKPIASGTGAYTPGTGNANGTVRSLVEKDVKVNNVDYHLFPGDELPVGATIVASTGQFLPGEVYFEKDDIIGKVCTELPPLMSSFSVQTSFFNPRALVETHYLTWSMNDLEHIKSAPFITLHKE